MKARGRGVVSEAREMSVGRELQARKVEETEKTCNQLAWVSHSGQRRSLNARNGGQRGKNGELDKRNLHASHTNVTTWPGNENRDVATDLHNGDKKMSKELVLQQTGGRRHHVVR